MILSFKKLPLLILFFYICGCNVEKSETTVSSASTQSPAKNQSPSISPSPQDFGHGLIARFVIKLKSRWREDKENCIQQTRALDYEAQEIFLLPLTAQTREWFTFSSEAKCREPDGDTSENSYYFFEVLITPKEAWQIERAKIYLQKVDGLTFRGSKIQFEQLPQTVHIEHSVKFIQTEIDKTYLSEAKVFVASTFDQISKWNETIKTEFCSVDLHPNVAALVHDLGSLQGIEEMKASWKWSNLHGWGTKIYVPVPKMGMLQSPILNARFGLNIAHINSFMDKRCDMNFWKPISEL